MHGTGTRAISCKTAPKQVSARTTQARLVNKRALARNKSSTRKKCREKPAPHPQLTNETESNKITIANSC